MKNGIVGKAKSHNNVSENLKTGAHGQQMQQHQHHHQGGIKQLSSSISSHLADSKINNASTCSTTSIINDNNENNINNINNKDDDTSHVKLGADFLDLSYDDYVQIYEVVVRKVQESSSSGRNSTNETIGKVKSESCISSDISNEKKRGREELEQGEGAREFVNDSARCGMDGDRGRMGSDSDNILKHV
uniref:Uncharacterized protein n=1 Tax=Polytomella parva TaxID=51329 RepID=A0A7S0YQJ9_9CHLO